MIVQSVPVPLLDNAALLAESRQAKDESTTLAFSINKRIDLHRVYAARLTGCCSHAIFFVDLANQTTIRHASLCC